MLAMQHCDLSILIPTHNDNCLELVKTLLCQAAVAGFGEYEVLVADDASTSAIVKEAHAKINELPHASCTFFCENQGRAKARNWLADHARYEWLLFLDADGMPYDENFLSEYRKNATDKNDVVVGTPFHPDRCPSPDVSLRWKYEKTAEKRFTAEKRNLHSFECFRSYCFMIRKELFLNIRFDEHFYSYGYEDTLLGSRLAEENANVVHITTRYENKHIETNEIFLEKTETANVTLKQFYRQLRHNSRLISHYEYLRLFGGHFFLAWYYRHFHEGMKRRLCQPNPSVWRYQWYKICHFCHLMRQ